MGTTIGTQEGTIGATIHDGVKSEGNQESDTTVKSPHLLGAVTR